MSKAKRRSRDFWSELVDQYEAGTDKTQDQFAEEHGVLPSTFKNWLYEIRKQRRQAQNPQGTGTVSFLALPSSSTPPAPIAPATVFLPNDVFLEFSSLPQPEYLATLMSALRESQ